MFSAGVNGPSASARNAKVRLGSATNSKAPSASSASASDTQPVRNSVGGLPPNVNGRFRGTLTVGFGTVPDSPRLVVGGTVTSDGIRWNSTKVYAGVDLQLVWWGQKATTPVATLHWTQGGKVKESIDYEVRTSADLFRRYLQNCEPLRLRLYSKRTATLIGTARVQIPAKIVNFGDSADQTTVAQASAEILSVRGFRLGDLCLEFALQLDPKELSASAPGTSTASQPQKGKENRKMLCIARPAVAAGPESLPLAVEGKTAPLHESSQRPLAGGATRKKFHTLDQVSKRKVLDYLTGKPIGEDGNGSERSALSEICSISPAESLLEALARYDAAPEPSKKSYLQAVDCVRVLVEDLRLTRAGLKEIQHRTKHQWHVPAPNGFVVKMKLSRNPSATCLKFCSASVAFDEADVSFEEQPKTTRLLLMAGRDEGLAFEFGIHLVVASCFTKPRQFFLGSATVMLRELTEGRFSCHKRCPVRLASDDILLGTLTVRMDLGSRGLHFGPELIDAVVADDRGNVTIDTSSESDLSDGPFPEPFVRNRSSCRQRPHSCGFRGAPSAGCFRQHSLFPHGSWTCTTHTGCPTDNPNSAPQQSADGNTAGSRQMDLAGMDGRTGSAGNDQNQAPGRDQPDPKAMDTEPDGAGERPKLLHGLLHLGKLRSFPPSDHFLVCHTFWTDEPGTMSSELCPESGDFDYLRTFPVLPNGAFIERVRNQHMQVELWQKPPGEGEKLVGVTRLPLHQFYIAFRDAQLSEHLSHAKLPVISIDGWTGIGSPLAAEPCGQIYAVLAIGTETQIEHFKDTRNLRHMSGDVPRTLANRAALPSSPTRRIYPRPEHKSIQTMSTGAGTKQPQMSEVANMLSAFIENLAQRLPISSERSTAPSYDHSNPPSGQPEDANVQGHSPHSNANRPQLRKTADLLDNLQKALAQRPPASALDGMGGALGALGGLGGLLGASSTPADQTPPAAGAGNGSGQPHDASEGLSPEDGDDFSGPSDGPPAATSHGSDPSSTDSSGSKVSPSEPPLPDECKVFRVAIEIEQAVNLPKLTISKKYAKRHKTRNVPEALELEPSAYTTFEGYNLRPGMPNTVKSHEGIVYTTHVVERNCAPGWQKRFEVQLPVDLMMNDEKRFILKVWRKAALSDAPKCRLLPAPMEDAVIGFCAIDLSVLLSGMPYILGWYNIMDFSGRCNGQIKVNVQPLENVQVYKTLDEKMNFQIPLSIDVDCSTVGIDSASNTSLSRALKRKFTELEEITERLKARLFDVTADDAADPDDQFERDLNTEAGDEDDDSWPDQLGDMSNRKRNSQYPHGAMTLTTNTSSYSMCATDRRVAGSQERSLTGCSNRTQPPQLQLEELLQTHDIDTLINPAILKNLLNPSTSDSTPPLGGDATDADMSDANSSSRSPLLPVDAAQGPDESGAVPTGGTDRVKQISSALQRTTISDVHNETSTTQSTSGKCREAPEGEPMKDVDN